MKKGYIKFIKLVIKIPFFLRSIIRYLLNKNTFKNRRNLAISLANPVYKQFYKPIIDPLLNDPHYNIICFGHQMYDLDTYSEYIQIFVTEPLIILSADLDFTFKKRKHRRVQMFHGLCSFGSIWGDQFIKGYDALLMIGPYMNDQLRKEKPYSELVIKNNVALYKVGYPKLDLLYGADNANSNKCIFYGPTYHVEFSSIFDWCETIFDLASKMDLDLILKLHPYLFMKNDKTFSGGIDWVIRIQELSTKYNIKVKFLKTETPIGELKDAFSETDIMITDVSGIGYEFVLATGKPIIFLGEKIKIPVGADRNNYLNYTEVKIRKEIGPVVFKKEELEEKIKALMEQNLYKENIVATRKNFVYNLGNAGVAALAALNEEFKKININ